MGVVPNAKETVGRFSGYIGQLTDLCKSNGIAGATAPLKLVREWRSNREFREKWNKIWQDLISTEGGKVSITTAALIIGSVLGGVGVAALGGAIGLPLAVVLAPFGYLVGDELDERGWTKRFLLWVRGEEHAKSDLSAESQILLQAGADLDALAITADELGARCERIEKQLADILEGLVDRDLQIASLKTLGSVTEQRVVALEHQVMILRWISGSVLLLATVAILWSLAKLLPLR
jgi:hypothetical protein